ncbi:MAG: adenylate/guanylate cyclase domain-containing protein [Pirellulales bacterium]|nr:adenylate/guanylate cyclase domain-containing protein [Pirellulales bacterium]
MFTDIVGYSSISGQDQSKALNLVRTSKEIQKPIVEKHNGRWLKEMGDGAMAQFNSALDAVSCAIEIQRAARSDFDGQLRIGIHLGDVTIENEDVFGDGVNIASRLESIADPGGIYISESIEKAIQSQIQLELKDLGALSLKNVRYPVRTFAILGHGFPIPDFSRLQPYIIKKTKWTRAILVSLVLATLTYILYTNFVKSEISDTEGKIEKSIAVLAFDDMSPDKDQEYFSDGIAEEIINALVKIPGLKVSGRTSSFSYKGKDQDLKIMGEELGVANILEGSIRKSGDKIRTH